MRMSACLYASRVASVKSALVFNPNRVSEKKRAAYGQELVPREAASAAATILQNGGAVGTSARIVL
jgi:hypothetical protein